MKRFFSLLATALLLGSVVQGNDNKVDLNGPYEAPNPKDNVLFLENFNQDFHGRWNVINNEKYQGQWAYTKPQARVGIAQDYGLMVTEPARHYAIIKDFDRPIDNTNSDLVIQYEVKAQETHKCGGAYLKLISEKEDTENFNNETPYVIMFGPDKCGAETNKVHFIYRREHEMTKEWEEKHAVDVPTMPLDTKTHLYTLAIFKNNTYQLYVDMDLKQNASMYEGFAPPIQPPKEIDDPEDKKPEDWVDEAQIPDPEAVKPDDWDEDAPMEIPDPNDVKPEDWDEDAPLFIADPNAEKPDDWDDEEDGEWFAPEIPNPACQEHGCGPFTPRMIPNPEYKGKWSPPMIDNPAYKGEWKPRQIPNPEFYEVKDPYKLQERLGAVGIEIWTIDGKVMFDNILITDSLPAAMEYAESTWKLKFDEETKKDPTVEDEGMANKVQQLVEQAVEFVQVAINEYPVYAIGGGLGGLLMVIIFTLLCCSQSSQKDSDARTKKEEGESEKKTSEVKSDDSQGVRRRARKE